MTFMLYGTFFMLGAAFTLQRKGHIRTDTYYADWSPRRQATVDLVCYLIVFFLPIVFSWRRLGLLLEAVRAKRALVTSPLDADHRPLQGRDAAAPACAPASASSPQGHWPRGAWLESPIVQAGEGQRAREGAAMSNEVLGLVALGVLFAVIFIGFPIAFTLGTVALATGFIALGPVVFDLAVLQFHSVMKDTVLASVPFFLLMGFLLEQSQLVERLFTGIQQLLAGVRGSLYLAVLITATIFAAATGIVGSSVTLLGVMAARR